VVIPIAVTAIAAAACSSSSSGGGNNNSSNGKPTYTIGFQGPLSGGNLALGVNERDGVQLAIEQANAAGNLPFNLKLETADDQGSSQGSPPAAKKLTSDSNVVAEIGPSFSGASDAAGSIYKKAGLLMVTPSATLPDIVTHGFTTFYRAVADDFSQGPPDAQYLVNKVGKKKIYVVDDATDYGVGLKGAFIGELTKLGLTPVGKETAPETSTCVQGQTGSTSQYPAVASKIEAAHPDAVFYAGYYCDFGLLAKQLRDDGYTGQLMSGDGSKDDRYISGAGAANANGTLISCQCSDIQSNPKGTQFVKDYTTRFGVAPGAYSAEAFDVANAIISVMKGGATTRSAIVAAWPNINYKGLTKTFAFNSQHNLKKQTAFLYQVKAGKLVYLGNLQKLAS
jgi:branched-chain amino acid transport system substrate-binding protein